MSSIQNITRRSYLGIFFLVEKNSYDQNVNDESKEICKVFGSILHMA